MTQTRMVGKLEKLVSNSWVTTFNSLWPLCKMEIADPAFAQVFVIGSRWGFLLHVNPHRHSIGNCCWERRRRVHTQITCGSFGHKQRLDLKLQTDLGLMWRICNSLRNNLACLSTPQFTFSQLWTCAKYYSKYYSTPQFTFSQLWTCAKYHSVQCSS